MRDPEDDDPPARDSSRGGFNSNNLRRKLGEGLAGLLDPDGAFGKGKEIVTGVTTATKNEVVRMISAEVRQFLDGMDTVDLLQRVIAGLVIDVKAEIRFSVDPEGQLKSSVKTKESSVRSDDAKKSKAESRDEPKTEPRAEPRADSKAEPRAEPRPEARPRPESRPDAKSEPRAEARTDGRTAPREPAKEPTREPGKD